MRKANKVIMGGVAAAAAGTGYLLGKKRYGHKSSYQKLVDKLEDILD